MTEVQGIEIIVSTFNMWMKPHVTYVNIVSITRLGCYICSCYNSTYVDTAVYVRSLTSCKLTTYIHKMYMYTYQIYTVA